jgi:hypothetical protein
MVQRNITLPAAQFDLARCGELIPSASEYFSHNIVSSIGGRSEAVRWVEDRRGGL